jgi:hypothetical protein
MPMAKILKNPDFELVLNCLSVFEIERMMVFYRSEILGPNIVYPPVNQETRTIYKESLKRKRNQVSMIAYAFELMYYIFFRKIHVSVWNNPFTV